MTGNELMAAVTFIIGLLAAASGIWFRVESKIGHATNRADRTSSDLAAHKLHVAEVYVSKQGLQEVKAEILGAVSGIKDDLRHITIRIDGVHETQSARRPNS